jgi:hypothetical protein
MTGVARLVFAGGRAFLPLHDSYDRQMLVEHVLDGIRSNGRIQVTINKRSWAVCRSRAPMDACCCGCGHFTSSVCHAAEDGDACYCVPCALLGQRHSAPRAAHERRAAS